MNINRVFSNSLFLIITDGRIRRMQMDKSRVLPCRFGASRPQAIVVTRMVPYPFGLYLLLDVWCILGDTLIFKIDA